MCGIAGKLTFDGSPVSVHEIETLVNALDHRGKDSAAVALGGPRGRLSRYEGLALGHRRLSIIDLTVEAAQPMSTQEGRYWIVYNGELYNYSELRAELAEAGHRFRTQSDTEVVLVAFAEWGSKCLERFNGMFAFAIWDESSQSLFCARDPLGIKPFYFTATDRSFCFASESQALVREQRGALDDEAVFAYFASMYVPGHMSIFAGVHKLLPGHSLTVTRDGIVNRQRYWTMPRCGYRNCSLDDAARELQEVLDQAVQRQLRSDVPVGALLSGGYDSGMIVASATRNSIPLHTYSVGFDDGRQFNELSIAKALAVRCGTIHHERVIRSEEIVGLLDRAIARMSEPVADSAIVPTYALSQLAAGHGVKVLLSGTGGDEVFAGYSRYVGSNVRRKLWYAVPNALRQAVGRTLFKGTSLGARMRHASLDMMMVTGGSLRLAGHVMKDKRPLSEFLESLATDIFPAPEFQHDPLYQHMQFDLQVYLPDLLLMLLDQLTMAHTVEGRVPLLDVPLVTASYSFSAELHANPFSAERRRLMKRMAQGRLDPQTFTAPKQGFSGPVLSWIRNNQSRFMEVVMGARNIPVLSHLPLEQLWNVGQKRQDPFWAPEVFSLYCFSAWYHARVSA